MKCPFCGAELESEMALFGSFESETGRLLCSNQKCEWHQQTLEPEVWQSLIAGKKAQEDLECMKHNYSVVSEQKEIAYQNYLKITGDLQKQLQKAQDALKVATDFIGFVNASDRADAALSALAISKLDEIASITTGEK